MSRMCAGQKYDCQPEAVACSAQREETDERQGVRDRAPLKFGKGPADIGCDGGIEASPE